MPQDESALLDIAKAARLTQSFIVGIDQAAFIDDLKTRSAVLYQLLVVGEAVKRLSPAFRKQNPHIPWGLIAGMRDHLIHAYDTVDWEEVWITVTRDIPVLLTQLEPLLPFKPQN